MAALVATGCHCRWILGVVVCLHLCVKNFLVLKMDAGVSVVDSVVAEWLRPVTVVGCVHVE